MSESRLQRVAGHVVPIVLLLGLTLAFWRWYVFEKFVKPGPDIFTTDLYSQFYPKFIYGSRRLASGNVPLWNPHEFCGIPFLANLTTEVFYPFKHILFSTLASPVAIRAYIGLHIFLAGVFAYLFFRAVRLSRLGSFAGAVVWAFSVPLVFEAIYDPVRLATVSWFPLTLLCMHLLLSEGGLHRAVLLAAAVSLQFLAGYPPMLIPCITSLFIYYAVFSVGRWITADRSGRRALYRRHLLLIFSAALCLTLVAVQLLPFYELLGQSYRSGGVMAVSRLPTDFIKPVSLLLKGRSAVESPLFMGFAVFLLAAYGVFLSRNPVKKYLIVACAFGIFMALGATTPVSPFFHKFPPFKYNRYPFMWYYLFLFFVGGFVGLGLDYLRQACTLPGGFLRSGAAAVAKKDVVAVLLPVASIILFGCIGVGAREVLSIALTVAAVLALLFIKQKLIRRAAALLALVVIGVIYVTQAAPRVQFVKLPDMKAEDFRILPDDPQDSMYLRVAPGRVYSSSLLWKGRYFFSGISLVNGYEQSLILDRMHKVIAFYGYLTRFGGERWDRFANHPDFLNIMGARLISVPPDKIKLFANKAGYTPAGHSMVMNKNALPRWYLVRDAVVVKDEREISRMLIDDEIDLSKNVLIEEEAPQAEKVASSDSRWSSVRLKSYEPEEVILEARVDQPAFLVLNDSFYPGWKAYDNGRETHIYRANLLFRAVYLTPGTHLIRFAFEPASFAWGARLTLAGILVALGCLGHEAFRRWRVRIRKEQTT